MVGAVVSISIVIAVDAEEEFPATSVAVAVTVREPSAAGMVVHSNTPVVESAAHVAPDGVPSTDSCTTAPASAVPEIVGVWSFVMPSLLDDPESDAAITASPLGTDAATSIVTAKAFDGSLTTDETVDVAVMEYEPAPSVAVVHVNVPPLSLQVDPLDAPLTKS
jgi:hypothetical protein